MALELPHVRIPLVAAACAALFAVYGLWATEQHLVKCDRLAPDRVQCQTQLTLLFGRVPLSTTQFWLQEVAIDSEICDNTPRGGVRFCHRLTLLGDGLKTDPEDHRMAQPLPEIRTPLPAATIRNRLLHFIAGKGNQQLTFTMAGQRLTDLRTGVLGLLLAVVAWGFWDIQWPPAPVSPLAMDGTREDEAQAGG